MDGETAGEDDDVFGDGGGDGAETPRGEYGVVDVDREREFLEALRYALSLKRILIVGSR